MTEKNAKSNKIVMALILFLLFISSLEQLNLFGKGFGKGIYEGFHNSQPK